MNTCESFLDCSPDAILIISDQGKILNANGNAGRLFGYSREELLGQNVEILIPQRFRKNHAQHCANYFQQSGIKAMKTNLDHYAVCKDGREFPVNVSLTSVRDKDGMFVVAAVRNVIELVRMLNDNKILARQAKESEKKLKTLNDDLEKRIESSTIELRLMNKLLQREISERERLEQEILRISEREQERIGQDLHDGLGQTLTAISYKAMLIEKQLSNNILPKPDEAAKIVKLVSETVLHARSLAKGLYPIELSRHGMENALKELAIDVSNKHNISCKLTYSLTFSFDEPVAIQIYRIIQEAVNNAVKHGSPKNILISLENKSNGSLITVRDDGKGLWKEPAEKQGIGINIMKYRAGRIGGKLHIKSSDGGGTVVYCFIENKKLTEAASNN